MAALSL